jgi:hypothetical protein
VSGRCQGSDEHVGRGDGRKLRLQKNSELELVSVKQGERQRTCSRSSGLARVAAMTCLAELVQTVLSMKGRARSNRVVEFFAANRERRRPPASAMNLSAKHRRRQVDQDQTCSEIRT